MSEEKTVRNWSMLVWLWVSFAALILDQWTKYLAKKYLVAGDYVVFPFLKFSLTENPGAAWGFLRSAGGWQRWMFVAIAVGFSVLLINWISTLRKTDRLAAISLTCILGGAWGNLWDRLFSPGLVPQHKGAVIDFISVHYGDAYYFPTFNIADSFITVGVFLLILVFIGDYRRERKAKQAAST